jgi:hypothetical protein
VAAQLVASRVVLSSTELVSYVVSLLYYSSVSIVTRLEAWILARQEAFLSITVFRSTFGLTQFPVQCTP